MRYRKSCVINLFKLNELMTPDATFYFFVILIGLMAGLIYMVKRSNDQDLEKLKGRVDDNPSDIEARLLLASQYKDNGDYGLATKEYEAAAELGSARACLEMASMLSRDDFRWKLKAAELNDVSAMFAISQAYKEGSGVLKNIGESTRWLLKSAEWGRVPSMIEIADAYATGYGIDESPMEGLAWLYVAEFKGDSDAANYIKDLEKKLSNDLVLIAQNRAKLILELIKEGKSTHGTAIAGSRPTDRGNSVSVKPNHSPKGSGSGAVVSVDGHVVTAAHVLKGATYVEVVTTTGTLPAIVLNVDEANDLALLKVEQAFDTHIRLGRSSDVRLGQTVSTIGFPNIGIQGHSPKVTQGMVSGENGIQNDIRMWQISVPIQPGNSGGPLLDEKGRLIGVVVATLSLRAIQITGSVPQNVNYAIKGAYLEPMLGFHKLKPSNDEAEQAASFQDMVAEAQRSAVLILVY
jgi:S1-C subfamily serine protease